MGRGLPLTYPLTSETKVTRKTHGHERRGVREEANTFPSRRLGPAVEASAPTMLRRALSRSVVSRVITLARPQRPLLQPPWRALCSGASKGDGDGKDGNGKPAADDSVLEAEPVEDVEEGTYGSLVKHDQHNISTMPPVLAFPFSNRPLFPGVYQPCEVTHDGLVAALVAAKVSSNPYVAVFLPRPNPETGVAPELTNITDPSEVHEVGTLAQITRLTQTPRGVQILLLGGRRVTMQRVVQNTPVMLAKVAEAKDVVDEPDAGPSLAKAYAMEVMQTIKEILKLNPFFKEQMQVHAFGVPSECLRSAF